MGIVSAAKAALQHVGGGYIAWCLLPTQQHRSKHNLAWIPASAGMTPSTRRCARHHRIPYGKEPIPYGKERHIASVG